MTTKVTVDAHAGWPVDVTPLKRGTDEVDGPVVRVEPNKVQDFYVHDGRDLLISEVKRTTA